MQPYTLRRASLAGARDFYYRACVFEALHMPFFVALVFLAVLVLTAVAMAVSTRFREVVTLVVCVAVLELGLVLARHHEHLGT